MLLLTLLYATTTPLLFGQGESATEYQLKAAFLYNFAKFVEWPPAKTPRADSPLVIGVIGKDPFGSDLENTLQGKLVEQRPITIRRFNSLGDLAGCHILFIASSEQDRLGEILHAAREMSVLTVADGGEFTGQGVAIGFRLQGGMIRFLINPNAAERAGIRISSKLLRLAQIVSEDL